MRVAAAVIALVGTAFLILGAFEVIPLPRGALWAVAVAPASWIIAFALVLTALRRDRRSGLRPAMEQSPALVNVRERILPGAALLMSIVVGAFAIMFVAIEPASATGWLALGMALVIGIGGLALRRYFRAERRWTEQRTAYTDS